MVSLTSFPCVHELCHAILQNIKELKQTLSEEEAEPHIPNTQKPGPVLSVLFTSGTDPGSETAFKRPFTFH